MTIKKRDDSEILPLGQIDRKEVSGDFTKRRNRFVAHSGGRCTGKMPDKAVTVMRETLVNLTVSFRLDGALSCEIVQADGERDFSGVLTPRGRNIRRVGGVDTQNVDTQFD